jgi:hypothetical protein
MLPINLFSGPPAHGTKWTVVVDRPRAARTLTLFDTQAEANAEIIRLRERGVAHVFALAPVAPCGDRPPVAAAVVGAPRPDAAREEVTRRPANVGDEGLLNGPPTWDTPLFTRESGTTCR